VISVVCVYNDERAFSSMLEKSVQKQTSRCELISVDNSGGAFKSAASALNHTTKQAHGDYLMFVHQDVILPDEYWLANAEKILEGISKLGVAGCAGVDDKGRKQGFIRDRYYYWGEPLTAPKQVQTLDESVLIIPRKVFEGIQFDEDNFKGWHCYGADYCLTAGSQGLRTYVIPNPIYHNSPNFNIEGLLHQHKILFQKHKSMNDHIYTTSGSLSRNTILLGPTFELMRKFYVRLFPQFFSYVGGILRRELSGCKSVLDVGWQRDVPIQSLTKDLVNIELHTFDASTLDWRGLGESKFDAVIALDVLHCFPNQDGHSLLKKLENLARRKLIVLCPNGDLYPSDSRLSELQKSAWTASELRNLGFKVHGVNGCKPLRGYDGEIKFGPNLFWQLVSDLSQKLLYFYPTYSFELVCIKKLETGGN
jgi:hypothetical protein